VSGARDVHRFDLPSGRAVELHVQQLPQRTVIRFRGMQPALDAGDQSALLEQMHPVITAADRPGIPMTMHNPHSGEVVTVHDEHDEHGGVCIEVRQAQS
jgi:hypothetical protein